MFILNPNVAEDFVLKFLFCLFTHQYSVDLAVLGRLCCPSGGV